MIEEKKNSILIKNIVDVLKNIEPGSPGMLRGEAGIILSLFYYARLENDPVLFQVAQEKLYRLYDTFGEKDIRYSYGDGIAGIYWLIIYLQKYGFIHESNLNELVEDIEAFLIKALFFELQRGNFDFLYGGIGVANALLNRSENLHLLDKIVQYIEMHAIMNKKGEIKWKNTGWGNLPATYNLGISHGMLSIIVYLSKVYEIKKDELVLNLIRGGVKFFLKQKKDSIIQFPTVVYLNGRPQFPSLLGWCYGDLGIGISLLLIGKRIEELELQNEAIKILTRTTLRNNHQKEMLDASLCHGAAGASHIYYRCHCETGMQQFKDSSDYWLKEALKMSKFEDGYAGFKRFTDKGWENDAGFLCGVSGILLALSSQFYNDKICTWDQALLLN